MSQMRPRRRRGGISLWDIAVLRRPACSAGLAFGLIGSGGFSRPSVRVGWRVEGLGQSAVDRGEVEIALGHACGDGVGAGGADSGGEILQCQRLEAGLGGIVRDEFGADTARWRLGIQR